MEDYLKALDKYVDLKIKLNSIHFDDLTYFEQVTTLRAELDQAQLEMASKLKALISR